MDGGDLEMVMMMEMVVVVVMMMTSRCDDNMDGDDLGMVNDDRMVVVLMIMAKYMICNYNKFVFTVVPLLSLITFELLNSSILIELPTPGECGPSN